jgi:hypothetical protein
MDTRPLVCFMEIGCVIFSGGCAHLSVCDRPQTMSDSLMYRLSYYRFAEASQYVTGQRGFDRVRNAQIGLMDFRWGGGRLTDRPLTDKQIRLMDLR